MSETRSRVLSLYRQILRTARDWRSAANNAEAEKQYIREEARRLFKANKHLTDAKQVQLKIDEAEARLQIGLHYCNPYPRPVYAPPHSHAGERFE